MIVAQISKNTDLPFLLFVDFPLVGGSFMIYFPSISAWVKMKCKNMSNYVVFVASITTEKLSSQKIWSVHLQLTDGSSDECLSIKVCQHKTDPQRIEDYLKKS